MPKLMNSNTFHTTLSNFKFSAVEMEKLGGSEYTIVQILVDESGSVSSFANDLENVLSVVADSCKKSPRAENLLIRAASFSSNGRQDNVKEIHGFSLLNSIDVKNYKGSINPSGTTPLYDAALSAVESIDVYGKSLHDQEYLCNGIIFVVTDGAENASVNNDVKAIKKSIDKMKRNEHLESVRTILIGVNDSDAGLRAELDSFKSNAGFDEYISLGDITAGKLAKLAQFVSRSISSTSQALGSGKVSQPVDFNI